MWDSLKAPPHIEVRQGESAIRRSELDFTILRPTMIFGDARGHWRIQLLQHHLNSPRARGKLRKSRAARIQLRKAAWSSKKTPAATASE